MVNNFSIIVPVHNEGSKPRNLLQSIKENVGDLSKFSPEKILLVVSGDKNDLSNVRKEYDLPLEIIQQEERRGKANAINKGLRTLETDIIVLVSGDVILGDNTLKKLLHNLKSSENGVVTGKPLPNVEDGSFIDYFTELVWNLHDKISSIEPKAGEVLAFRNVINSLPEDTAADEEFIKALILKKGYKSRYSKDAIVYNKGPQKLSDLFEQRRRIYIGHLDLKSRTHYKSPSMDKISVLKALINYMKENKIGKYFFFSIMFESFARLDALSRYLFFGENPYIWKQVG